MMNEELSVKRSAFSADTETQENESTGDRTGSIFDSGSVTACSGKYKIHCLTIIGQIEGHYISSSQNKTTKYEHVIPQLVAVEEDPSIDGLLLLLNTVGGDIEAGLALAELIAGMRKPTVSLVLGGGHSIGVPLAVCAKRSMIVPTASMTIHPVRMNGVIVGAPPTYRYFNCIQEQIVDFVTDHSRISRQQFLDYMMQTGQMATDVGTVVYGREAVACGLIDQLGSLGDALSCLHKMISKRKKDKR